MISVSSLGTGNWSLLVGIPSNVLAIRNNDISFWDTEAMAWTFIDEQTSISSTGIAEPSHFATNFVNGNVVMFQDDVHIAERPQEEQFFSKVGFVPGGSGSSFDAKFYFFLTRPFISADSQIEIGMDEAQGQNTL